MKGWSEIERGRLFEQICAESEKAAAGDAQRALNLAYLALKFANLARGRPEWRFSIRSYAWAFVGNARRVANDLVGADEAFAISRSLWPVGRRKNSQVLDRSRILGLEASLRRDQRRWPEALSLLERAQHATQSENAKVRFLLQKSSILEQMGNYHESIKTLCQIRGLETEPRLLFGAHFNLAVNYCHVEKYDSAAELLRGAQWLARELGNELDLIRTAWLEGRVLAGLGQRLEAIPLLERVREEFTHRELGCDMALVSLELAVLYLEEGRLHQVRELAQQIVILFKSQGLYREMLAVFRLLWEPTAKRRSR